MAERKAKELSKPFIQVTKDNIPTINLDIGLLKCPSCEHDTFVFRESDHDYICTYCKHHDKAVECECCHTTFPVLESIENIEEAYWCSKQCLQRSMKSKGVE
jgi:uncharacterized protein YbaR (Trm112 family)